jgi:malate permease and related proteins
MSSLLLLIVCLAAGVLVARFARPPAVLASSLNWWVLNVALSALVLHLIPQLKLDFHLWFPIAAMWFVFFGGWALFAIIGRALHWSRGRIGALTLVAGLGNTAFVGFPLIEALRGQEGLRYALVADQAGTFIMLAVGGTLVAAIYSGSHVSARTIVRKLFYFPPFVSLLLGVVVGVVGRWPAAFDSVLDRIGATLVPMALFSVGLQLNLRFGRGQLQAIVMALGWKLALAPAIVALAGMALGVTGMVYTIAVLQAAMAPMISAAILATQNELEPELANTILGAGILLSFVSVPLVDHWLRL